MLQNDHTVDGLQRMSQNDHTVDGLQREAL
jgi:hypothetical protein